MSLTNSPFWFSSGATSAGGGGTVVYPTSINQSLRVDDSKSQRMYQNTVAGSAQKFTMSCWIKRTELSDAGTIFSSWNGASNFVNIYFSGDYLYVYICDNRSGFVDYNFNTQSAVGGGIILRDVSAWYHIVVAVDTTQSYVYDRYKIYINGVDTQARSGGSGNDLPLNYNMEINEASGQNFIFHNPDSATYYGSFYVADMVYVDGTMYDANTFGEFINGIWVPKDISAQSISYGNNGFYLTFSDNSTASALGTDSSGNGNNFTTVNNFATNDQVPDSPTNNFATWNPLDKYNYNSPSEGNLRALTAGNNGTQNSTFAVSSGKWYFEVRNGTAGSATVNRFVGIAKEDTNISSTPYLNTDCYLYYSNGNKYNGSGVSYGDSWQADGDIIGIAFDADNGAIWFSKNGTWQNSATASEIAAGTTTNAAFTGLSGTFVMMVSKTGGTSSNDPHDANFGQEGTFAGTETAGGNADDNGYGDFKYAPPSGFLAMCSANLPEPAIGPQLASGQQSDNYFEPILYTGNGATQHIGSGGAQHPIDVTTVANSIRFNDSDSAYLSYTPASDGNRKIYTISLWFKRGNISTAFPTLIGANVSSGRDDAIRFGETSGGNDLYIFFDEAATGLRTNRVFTDTAAWYHLVLAVDTTQATNTDRVKLYINGVQETSFASASYPAQNYEGGFSRAGAHNIGRRPQGNYFDGYIAETYFIDGTALDPTSFGQYGSNGYWIPKAVSGLTFGDNGFYLDYSDNSTATALGTDSSGNANNFSATNVATTDQMGDSPTQNFNTLDPSRSGTDDLSEGNLLFTEGNGLQRQAVSTFFIPNIESSTLWYVECKPDNGYSFGIGPEATATGAGNTTSHTGFITYYSNGSLYLDTSSYTYGASYNETNLLSMVIGNGQIEFFKDNVSQGVAQTGLSGGYRVVSWAAGAAGEGIAFNFGQDDSFCGYRTPSSGAQAADANGYGSFYYTPPTGALAIVNDNIPVEGLTGPNFVWIKERNSTANHYLFDTIRGATKNLHSNTTDAEATDINSLTSFDYQGFTIGSDAEINTASNTYVAWNWKAGGKANTFNIDGTGYASIAASPISDGTIPLTGLSTNTTSGFSILGYAGTGSNGTVAHGLSSAPEMFICRNRTNARDWLVYHKDIGYTKDIFLNLTNAERSNDVYQQQAPDNSLIYLETQDRINESGSNHIMWCFHSVDGYSRVGKYVGNANADGTFVYTGFRPAWVMIKRSDSTSHWALIDSARSPYNVSNAWLAANLNNSESSLSNNPYDLLSNGFKARDTLYNVSGGTYIYLAFAEAPFKYANAR